MSIPSPDTKLAVLDALGYGGALDEFGIAGKLGCSAPSAARQASEMRKLGLLALVDDGILYCRTVTGDRIAAFGQLTPELLLRAELGRIGAVELDAGFDEAQTQLLLRGLPDPYVTPENWRSLLALLLLCRDGGGIGAVRDVLAGYLIGARDGEERARELAEMPPNFSE